MTLEESREQAADGPCILVADDSNVVRYTVSSIIKSMGYRVVEASDGRQVLEMVEKHHPDLVILDIHMPEKGGIETLAELRADARHARLPVVVLTASADPKVVRQVAHLKASGYLVKENLSARELRTRISKLLGESAAPSAAPAASASARSSAPRRPLQDLHVMLVDDNPLDQQLIAGLLTNWGCRVETADDGHQALELLDAGTGFDLVLMDASMPEMDGLAATAEIRRREVGRETHLPVALLTSKPFEVVEKRSQEVGMDAYIAKPVEADQLFTAIEGMAALSRSREGRGTEEGTPFDRAELLERVDDDMELLQHLVELFLRDYPQLVTDMRQSATAGDAETMTRAAHTMKGMLGNLSAHATAQLALKLETMGRQEKLEGANEVLDDLEADLERLIAALEEFL